MTETQIDAKAELTRTVDGRLVPVAATYTLDAAHSSVGFVARHMMVTKVRGAFAKVAGTLVVHDDPTVADLEVTVDVDSIATRDEQRDAHLRSADFFDVEHFPTMRFVASRAYTKGDDWVVEGALTIKDVTRPISLDVEFLGGAADPWGGSRLGFSASTEVNREDFGLGWNVLLEAGGAVVGKTVKLEIEAELIRQS